MIKLGEAAKYIVALSKKPIGVFAWSVGLVSGLLAIWQAITPVPVTIAGDDLRKALAGRSPCEVIAARGLPCSPDGLIKATATSREMIDLFIAAGINGNSVVSDDWNGTDYVWKRAYLNDLPETPYLVHKTIEKNGKLLPPSNKGYLESRCDLEDLLTTEADRAPGFHPCTSLGTVSLTKDDGLFCDVYFTDSRRDRFSIMPPPNAAHARYELWEESGVTFPLKRIAQCEEKAGNLKKAEALRQFAEGYRRADEKNDADYKACKTRDECW